MSAAKPTFAIVAEGPTDQVIIASILTGFFKALGIDNGDIMRLQPPTDETGRQASDAKGGWHDVIRWLSEGKYDAALSLNDHLIVQIDTDVSEEVGYDVSKRIQGAERTTEELVLAVRDRLIKLVDPTALAAYSGRIHFAIAVHSTECWLLPLYCSGNGTTKTIQCKEKLDYELNRLNKPGLRKDRLQTYDNASKAFRKLAALLASAEKQRSLNMFLESMKPVADTFPKSA